MNSRKFIFIFIVVLLALIYFWWPKHQPMTDQLSVERSRPTEIPAKQPLSSSALSGRTNTEAPSIQEQITGRGPVLTTADRERPLWESPIYYFGKVIDENGNAISGVKVSFKIHAMNEKQTEDVNEDGEATTDQRGMFRVEVPHGIGVMVQLSHPKYYADPNNVTGFDKRSLPKSGYFSDREENAELFRMHSKGTPVSLVHREGALHIQPNGAVGNFAFRGENRTDILSNAQIQGWKGNPDPQASGHYDWKVQIQVADGGLIESTNFFDFIAPETGYSNKFEIGISKNDTNWQTHAEKKVFFNLQGHYIRASISVDVFHDIFISMDYFANPSGSRNLEFDPNAQ